MTSKDMCSSSQNCAGRKILESMLVKVVGNLNKEQSL